ncbi:MAG: hypoxanthine phosphoribosyltransferase [Bacteroidota bacterium]
MPDKIFVKDRYFSPFITEEEIQSRISELAAQIRTDFAGITPVFLGVLNGAFMFAADLMKYLEIECEITFVKLASYQGMSSTGAVKTALGLEANIEGRHVIVIEDIIDTGVTMKHFLKTLEAFKPASVAIMTLLWKKEAMKHELPIDYVGFEIPNKFVVGYGLDYDQIGRNWKDIYHLAED